GELMALNDRIEQGKGLLDEAMAQLETTGLRDAVAAHVAAAHAHWLQLAGRSEVSSAAYDAAVSLATDVYRDPDHLEVVGVRRNRAFLWRRLGRLDEAEAELRHLIAVTEKQVGPLDPDLFDLVLVLAKTLRDEGKFAEALPWFEQRLQLVR